MAEKSKIEEKLNLLKLNVQMGLISKTTSLFDTSKAALSLVTEEKKSMRKKELLFELFPNFDSLRSLWSLLDLNLIQSFAYFQFTSPETNECAYLKHCFEPITVEKLDAIRENPDKINLVTSDNPIEFKNPKSEDYTKVRFLANFPLFSENRERIKKSIVIHIHGGGFIAMSTTSCQSYLKRLVKYGDFFIVSIDYNLAPEFKYPYALNQVYQIYRWLLEFSSSTLNIEIDKIFIFGDSAGGKLSISLFYLTVLTKLSKLADALFLFYPAISLTSEKIAISSLVSMEDFLIPYYLFYYIIEAYAGKNNKASDFFLHPINAPDWVISKMPRTVFFTADTCSLRDFTYQFVDRMLGLDKEVKMYVVQDMIHGYLNLNFLFMLNEVKSIILLLKDEIKLVDNVN